MEEQDRVSQASSIATISSLATRNRSDGKIQTFGKRCQAVKRDPNCPVVIRGWLWKRDSTGLKLWKRRWFVLSDYCLFYYKDSREESVLGSIPLPSYKIFLCCPRECKNRKYAFKVVHQGMRPYLLSADTQEDMLGWVRALSQSACMENEGIINRRCASFQDFTQIGGSTESVTFPQRDRASLSAAQIYRPWTDPPETVCVDVLDQRGRRRLRQSGADVGGRSLSLDRAVDDSSQHQHLAQASCPTSPKGHHGSRPHTPVGRVDISPPSPSYHTVSFDRWASKASTSYSTLRQVAGKTSHGDELPPLPPSRVTHNPPGLPHTHLHHMPVCVYPPSAHLAFERETQPLTTLQEETDMLLTRLCGCDKILHTLSVELDHLQADKERVQFTLEMARLQLDEQQLDEQEVSQKTLLQDELVVIRARLCDVSLEMERVWADYERMESELCVFRSHLQHICHFGLPQERSQAQRQLWMMEDILCGLKSNRRRFRLILGLQRRAALPVALQNSSYCGEESEPPSRPPLPHDLKSTSYNTELNACWAEPCHKPVYSSADLDSVNHRKPSKQAEAVYEWEESDTVVKKRTISEAEQRRLRCDEERLANKRKHQESSAYQAAQRREPDKQLRPLTEGCPSPLRVLRVVTAVLPSSLVARRVSVEDPPPELATPLPEQICPAAQETQSKALSTQHHNQHPEGGKKQERGEEEISNEPANVELQAQHFIKTDFECDAQHTTEKRDAKLRRVERIRERVLRSTGSAVDALHPLRLVQHSDTLHSDSVTRPHDARHNHVVRRAHHGNRSLKPLLNRGDEIGDVPSLDTKFCNIKHVDPPSTNHMSAITVISKVGPQEVIHALTPQSQNVATLNSNCSASTNQRAEWFLSTHQWQEFIPLNIKDEEPTLCFAASQHSDQPTKCCTNVSEVKSHKGSGRHHSPGSVVSEENQQSASLSIQPQLISPDSHMTLPFDQSKTELCIYEEIPYEDSLLKLDTEVHVSAVGKEKIQQLDLSTNQNVGPALSSSHVTTLETGERKSGATTATQTPESGEEQESNVIKTEQPIYSCVIKNSAANHSTPFLKPRVTVVSTSL